MHQKGVAHGSNASLARSTKLRILIDTDIGDDIDDALALALALQSSEIELLGVTTVFGDTQRRAQLAAHLLRVFGNEKVPVAAGIERPLQPLGPPSGVAQAIVVEASEKFPSLSPLKGPELIIQTALAYPGELTLLCIGPLTNVATALKLEPRIFMAIRRIIMMGGSASIPLAEWNVRNDVLAAQIVLAAGIPITMLGMDVTLRCHLMHADIACLQQASQTPQVQLLGRLLSIWQEHRPRWQPTYPYLHDPLTITALCAPELFRFEEMPVRVLMRGPFKGTMITHVMNGSLVHAAVTVQALKARQWIMQRLLSQG